MQPVALRGRFRWTPVGMHEALMNVVCGVVWVVVSWFLYEIGAVPIDNPYLCVIMSILHVQPLLVSIFHNRNANALCMC